MYTPGLYVGQMAENQTQQSLTATGHLTHHSLTHIDA